MTILVLRPHRVSFQRRTNFQSGWCHKTANWNYFTELCDRAFSNLSADNIDETTDKLSETIISAAKAAIKKSKPGKKVTTPWWNHECAKATRLKRAALLKMRRSLRMQDVIDYKHKRASARKILLEAKKTYCRQFCESLTEADNMTKVWNIFNSMNRSITWSAINYLQIGQFTINTDLEIANALASQFANASKSTNYDPEFLSWSKEASHISEALNQSLWAGRNFSELPINQPFSQKEFSVALGHRKSTAPGQDDISYPMINHLSSPCQRKLLEILNDHWKKGQCPTAWRHAIIVPLLKYGKPAESPNPYRPICLTSVICKIMELMIANRLKWYLDKNNLLIDSGHKKNV